MAIQPCPECARGISDQARSCPHCGYPLREQPATAPATNIRVTPRGRVIRPWGFEWRTETEILGWPLVHVAFGRDPQTLKLRVAKGVVAVGQFGIGVFTIAQFGIGLLFGFGQFVAGYTAIGQFALALHFGLGQFATGLTAIGQFAFGRHVLAQIGVGKYVWSTTRRDPEALQHFQALWDAISSPFHG